MPDDEQKVNEVKENGAEMQIPEPGVKPADTPVTGTEPVGPAAPVTPMGQVNIPEAKPRKKMKKSMIIILVVVLLLVLGAGVVALVMMNSGKNQEDAALEMSQNTEETTDKIPGTESEVAEVVEVDPESSLVKGVYEKWKLDNVWSDFEVARYSYGDAGLLSGIPSLEVMVDLAARNLERTTCKLENTPEKLKERYGERSMGGYEYTDDDRKFMYETNCYDGAEIRREIATMFGKEVILPAQVGTWYKYDADLDEYYSISMGRGGVYESYGRELTGAETEGNKLYLYEDVHINGLGMIKKADDSEKQIEIQEATGSDGTEEIEVIFEKIREYVKAHPEYNTRYKWTFVKDAAGNYAFEKLEVVE